MNSATETGIVLGLEQDTDRIQIAPPTAHLLARAGGAGTGSAGACESTASEQEVKLTALSLFYTGIVLRGQQTTN